MDYTETILSVILFCALALVVGVLLMRDQRVKNELREQGVHTSGYVTARQHNIQNNMYYVSYQYAVGGATYNGRESVDAKTYEILREGQPVEVVYMPTNPAQARLASAL